MQRRSITGVHFGSDGPDAVAAADIDNDGLANIQDLAIAAGNFGKGQRGMPGLIERQEILKAKERESCVYPANATVVIHLANYRS